jgi:protein O-mannosyl-transferase
MAKKDNRKPQPIVANTIKAEVNTKPIASETLDTSTVSIASDTTPSALAWLTKGIIPYILICLLGTTIYWSIRHHQLALDDDIVISKNEFVLQGIKGIPEIFKYDVFESFYRQMNTRAQLTGGRYRPFSIATFAIEQEFIGKMIYPDSILNIKDANQQRIARNAFVMDYLRTRWDVNKNGKGDKGEDINGDGLYNDKDSRDTGMGFRHVTNIGLYVLSICFVFLFLTTFFLKQNKLLALFICLLFVAHPLHTEVVANVKSRDEILSLMFMTLSLHFGMLGYMKQRWWAIALASLFFIIALMSKEYAITLMFIYPLCVYIYFKNITWVSSSNFVRCAGVLGVGAVLFLYMYSTVNGIKNDPAHIADFIFFTEGYIPIIFFVGLIVSAAGLYFLVKPVGLIPVLIAFTLTFMIYFSIRNCVVIAKSDLQDTELLNNPYLKADEEQVRPTKLVANLYYAGLLIYPAKLSCDYSYTVIPYKNFSSPEVILSILMLIGTVVALVITIKQKHWMSIAIAFALLHLMLVNNTLFDIGATMGERLVYHSSLGTCMLLAYGAWWLFKRYLPNNNIMYIVPLVLLLAAYTAKSMQRAPQWKNDITLHLTDVQTYPNSTMLNGNACTRLIELSELPKNEKIAGKLLDSAKIYGRKSLVLHDKFVNSFLNMGIIFMKQNNYDSAKYYWGGVERLYPNHPQLPSIRNALANMSNADPRYSKAQQLNSQGRVAEAVQELLSIYATNKNNPVLVKDIANLAYGAKDYKLSKQFVTIGLQMNPTDAQLVQLQQLLQNMGVN